MSPLLAESNLSINVFHIFLILVERYHTISDFLLGYNCFTLLCQFLMYNKVNHLYVYIYSFPLGMLSHSPIPPTQLITEHPAELSLLYSRFPLAISFTHSDVSQKEKNKSLILMHICGIQKNDIAELICKTETETQMQRTNVCIPGGAGVGWTGRQGLMYILY